MFNMRKDEFTQAASGELGVAISSWLNENGAIGLFRTCGNCANLGSDDRTCSKFGAQPPVSVVLQGCDAHVDKEEIPY